MGGFGSRKLIGMGEFMGMFGVIGMGKFAAWWDASAVVVYYLGGGAMVGSWVVLGPGG